MRILNKILQDINENMSCNILPSNQNNIFFSWMKWAIKKRPSMVCHVYEKSMIFTKRYGDNKIVPVELWIEVETFCRLISMYNQS